jgi:hypothetical protein
VARAEAISPARALAMYTTGAAFVLGHEDRVGSLEAGKLADFTVLDRNPLTAPPETLAETAVELTVLGGRVTHDRARVIAHA